MKMEIMSQDGSAKNHRNAYIFRDYKAVLTKTRSFLENQSAELTIRGQKLVIHGLEHKLWIIIRSSDIINWM